MEDDGDGDDDDAHGDVDDDEDDDDDEKTTAGKMVEINSVGCGTLSDGDEKESKR